MRILMINYEYPPIGGGGGLACQELCAALIEHGHEVLVLTAHLRGLPHHETVQGVPIVRVSSLRREAFRAGFVPMAGFVVAGFWKGLQLVRSWRPDVIHVQFAVPSGPVAWALSKIYKIPYVLTAHLGDVPGGVPEKTGSWFRWIFPFTRPIWMGAKRVAAVSEYTRQIALKSYPVDIRVIPNAVDLRKFKRGNLRVGDPPNVVFAGRFMPQKNLLQFVRSLGEVRDLPWRSTMLGDGPLRVQVQAEVARLDLHDRFHFTGWVTPDEVLECFAESDILFMPSLSEGLPVVGVHALAMGMAIVCTDVGGFIDLVEPGENGFLVPLAQPDGYADALRELLSDPDKMTQFRLASLEIAQKFDISRISVKYEALYQECLEVAERR